MRTEPSETKSVATASLACFFAGGLYGWSALLGPLKRAFAVSMADAGLVFSLALVSFTAAVLLVPVVLGPASLRQIGGLSVVGALSVLGAQYAGSYALFLLCFSGGFGMMSGAVYGVAVALAARVSFFKVATPVVIASFGAGGAVFGPTWHLLDSYGWGLNGLGFLAAGLVAVGGLAFAVGGKAERAPQASPSAGAQDTQRVVVLWGAFALGSFSGLMILGLAAKILEAGGASVAGASVALAVVALGNTGGRLSISWLATRLGVLGCLRLSWGLTMVGLLTVLLSGIGVGLGLVALGYGMVAAAFPLLTRQSFGPALFQRRYAVIFTAWGFAGFCAPLAAGMLFDATGAFDLAILTAGAIAGLFGVFCFATRR